MTNGTDQLDFLTRNALCCLEETPPGYMPGMYVETYDPWGNTGTVANIPSMSETGFRNAIAVYAGATTLSSLFSASALDTALEGELAGNSAWVAECH